MIDLNEHAQKAQEIAFNRWKKKDVDYHTPAQECQQKNEARAMEGSK